MAENRQSNLRSSPLRSSLGFRGRVLIIFSLLFILTIISISLVRSFGIPFTGFDGEFGQEQKEVLRNLDLFATLKEEHLSQWLKERKNDARLLSIKPVVVSSMKDLQAILLKNLSRGMSFDRLWVSVKNEKSYQDLIQEFEAVMEIYPIYKKVEVAEVKTGRIIASTDGRGMGRIIKEEPFFQIGHSGEGEFVDVVRDRFYEKPHLVISRTISNQNPGPKETPLPLGVMVLYIDPEESLKPMLYAGVDLGKSDEIVLVNQERRIILSLKHPLPDGKTAKVLEHQIESQPAMLATLGKEGTIVSRDYRGIDVLAAHRYIPLPLDRGWGIVFKRDRSELFYPLLKSLFYSSLVGLAGIILGIGLISIIASRISEPIRSLNRTLQEVETGNLSARSSVTQSDEIGALASACNAMIERIQNWHKELEEQIRTRTDELARRNEEIRRFAYIVSHDMRAPLVNIKGFSSELRGAIQTIQSSVQAILPHLDQEHQKALSAALQEDIPEALGFIESSVNRMDGLINALSKLSRLGRREFLPERIDMDALVRDALKAITHQINERKARVSVKPLSKIVADRMSMEQIMGNILTNAVLYLVPNRPGEIEVLSEKGPHETIFHIRDNGRGIAEADIARIFIPFQRAGRQDVPGEGMGLAYVRALVERHGGRIWCQSQLGEGSTFLFSIPDRINKGGDHE